MTANRAAGYCSNCNRGVSIVKPQPSGFMNRVKSALQNADDDSGWVCTKCGHPATRGFAPPPQATDAAEKSISPDNPEISAPAASPEEPAPTPDLDLAPAGDTRNCPFCERQNPARAEICAACNKDMNASGKPEATCHLCNGSIEFEAGSAGQPVTCPGCSASVILPDTLEDSSALTKASTIIRLEDDPERPDVSKALCTECNFKLTYPKRLAGKNVDCPSCAVKFILP